MQISIWRRGRAHPHGEQRGQQLSELLKVTALRHRYACRSIASCANNHPGGETTLASGFKNVCTACAHTGESVGEGDDISADRPGLIPQTIQQQ